MSIHFQDRGCQGGMTDRLLGGWRCDCEIWALTLNCVETMMKLPRCAVESFSKVARDAVVFLHFLVELGRIRQGWRTAGFWGSAFCNSDGVH
jgi:hypothetical protein